MMPTNHPTEKRFFALLNINRDSFEYSSPFSSFFNANVACSFQAKRQPWSYDFGVSEGTPQTEGSPTPQQ